MSYLYFIFYCLFFLTLVRSTFINSTIVTFLFHFILHFVRSTSDHRPSYGYAIICATKNALEV